MIKENSNIQKLEEDIQGYIKKLKEDQSRFLVSVNNLPVGFLIIDTKNNILIKNPAIDKIFEIGDELFGNVLLMGDISTIENKLADSWDFKKNWETCLKEKKNIENKEVIFGKKFLHIFLAPMILDEDAFGVVVLVEDITEAKIIERSREEFFAIASHEMRTPLTAIRGNMSLIKDFFGDEIKNPEVKEMIDDSYKASVRLIGLVNEFLDVSKIEQNRVSFKKENVNLEALANDVARELNALVESKNLKLILKTKNSNPLPAVLADNDRAKQVIYNLLSNAINYTQKGEINAVIMKEGNFIKMSVTDTGVGISPQNQNRLFREFQQAGEKILARDITTGTGLGLYISKLLTEAMGGKIWLERSELGKGSTFAFTLPAAV